MAKKTGLWILGAAALIGGGVYLMTRQRRAVTGSQPGIRVEGDCERITVVDSELALDAIDRWQAENVNYRPATVAEATTRIWTYLAGCVPGAQTVIESADGSSMLWIDYMQRVGQLDATTLDTPGALADTLLRPLAPLLQQIEAAPFLFPQPNGNDGPVTPGGA